MESFPKSADYIIQKLCIGDHTACNRFKIYKEFGGKDIPPGLDPDDTEEVKKIIQCLRKKQGLEGGSG
ncbi:MAG: hypothetical protein WCD00_16435 [Desulfuromonadaceae bacterium]